jgi:hypothetical protein
LLEAVSRYPGISLALSVRTTYEKAVVPDGLTDRSITRVTHVGFRTIEEIAANTVRAINRAKN